MALPWGRRGNRLVWVCTVFNCVSRHISSLVSQSVLHIAVNTPAKMPSKVKAYELQSKYVTLSCMTNFTDLIKQVQE